MMTTAASFTTRTTAGVTEAEAAGVEAVHDYRARIARGEVRTRRGAEIVAGKVLKRVAVAHGFRRQSAEYKYLREVMSASAAEFNGVRTRRRRRR